MSRYAIIKGENVINVIEYDVAPSNPPPAFEAGVIAVQSDLAGPGWFYRSGEFIDPNPVIPHEINPVSAADKLASSGLSVDELKSLLGI